MNKETIVSLMESTKDDVEFAKNLSDKIVASVTEDLDVLMKEIHKNVVNADYVDDQTMSQYFLRLTNALYFLSSRFENFGFYDDITKANARLKYNESYAENQLNHASDPKKPTQNDNQLYAELHSVDENVLNIIYSRSVKIIKGKFDAASEMIRTLSKLLSLRMASNPTK